MPLQKLQFRPGLNREGTDYSNEGGFYDGDKIRFRSGFPEKIGGWVQLTNSTFIGICRALWNWVTLGGANLLGVGTSKKYYVEQGGTYNDITPLLVNTSGSTTTTLGASPLSTTAGSSIVTVTDAVSGISPNIGDYVNITSTATVGGLSVSGQYVVSSVVDIFSYKIQAVLVASTTATGGGTVTVQYIYPIGNDVYTISNGWGSGAWSPTNSVTLGVDPFTANAGNSTVTVTQASNGYLTSAGSFNIGQQYKIVAVGSTDFTLIGASSNTVGITFTATGVGTGSGTASIVWVSFSGATNLLPTPLVYGFSGTVGFGTGTYSMAGTDVVAVYATLLNKTFEITYVDSNSYTITLPNANAGSFTTGLTYIITSVGTTDFTAIGASSNTIGVSFVATGPGSGTGTASITALYGTIGGGAAVTVYPEYGIRGWGQSASVGIGSQLRLWTNDNYGQNLFIAPRGGGIYYWLASTGLSVRAQLLSTLAGSAYVPTATYQVLSSAIQKFVIAMGANPYVSGNPNTTFNPMLVRWSDQLNEYQWVPAVTNQAGEFTLTNGSYIMGARATRQEILIWTDACLYSMQYLGAPYVWGFNILMDNISVMSPNSMITANNITYWMGTDKFYMYSGRVETLPCSLRQFVFNDINQDQAYQVCAGLNEGFNEIWWFYCSGTSTVVDKYVIYNYLDRVWYYGTMGRSAWLDSGIRQYPIAADYNNRILYHENGVDDNATQTTTAIDSYVQSSDFDIGDGHNFGFVWRILPDVNFNGSNINNPAVTMTIKPRVNSGTPYGISNNPTVTSANNYGASTAYNIQEFTGQVYTRLRGRQLAFRIESTGIGVNWQLGSPRIDIRPDGRR